MLDRGIDLFPPFLAGYASVPGASTASSCSRMITRDLLPTLKALRIADDRQTTLALVGVLVCISSAHQDHDCQFELLGQRERAAPIDLLGVLLHTNACSGRDAFRDRREIELCLLHLVRSAEM